MTYEEAIERIEKHGIKDNFGFSDESDLDAEEVAIKAIEKQIPMKVLIYDTHPNTLYLCPTCNSSFVTRDNVGMNYCGNCGQRILFDRGMAE